MDLSTAGALSDVAESPLTNHDWFYEVAEDIDQLGNDEWDSENDLPADFVVANNPPLEYENPEDIPQIFNVVADNTFSAIVNGEMAIDIPHGTDTSHFIREIDVARSKRAQYVFNEFKSVIRTTVFDDNL